MALKKYDFPIYKGLYTDMTAIRRDDKVDETHSIYVDQWDWEKVITKKDRTVDYLKQTVKKIVKAVATTSQFVKTKGFEGVTISEDVFFITSQELLDMYPGKTDKEREYLITKEHKTVFIIGIGGDLSDGKPHDMRAPDYDDWSLDGDLLFYHEVLDMALEISSMGIRVDCETLVQQIVKAKKFERLALGYHQAILKDELPLTIGGGIGQSRLCMLLLGRAHIGEVQASYWDKETLKECEELKIELL
jgi:aspartate--ammonia ligase